MRCDQKGPGARRQTKLGCYPSEAWQRREWPFLIATRRERSENRAIRRCPPSQGPGLGVVTRLDWRGFHAIRTGKNSVNRPYMGNFVRVAVLAPVALRNRAETARLLRAAGVLAV